MLILIFHHCRAYDPLSIGLVRFGSLAMKQKNQCQDIKSLDLRGWNCKKRWNQKTWYQNVISICKMGVDPHPTFFFCVKNLVVTQKKLQHFLGSQIDLGHQKGGNKNCHWGDRASTEFALWPAGELGKLCQMVMRAYITIYISLY